MRRARGRETVIRVRSGYARQVAGQHDPGSFRRVKVVTVSGGARPLLWLGEGAFNGIAWVSGADTLRRIRDAIDLALADAPDPKPGKVTRRG